MAIYGGVREGWSYASGPRFNNTLFRGSTSVTGNATVTLPLPCRLALYAVATLDDTAPVGTDVALVTVGSFSNNTFKIYAWKATSSSVTTLIAATAAFTVMWVAWGDCSGGQGY